MGVTPLSFTVTAGTLGKTTAWYFASQKCLQRCDILKGCAKTSSNVIQLLCTTVIWKKTRRFSSIFHSKPDKKKPSKSKAWSVKTHCQSIRFPPCPSLVEFGSIQELVSPKFLESMVIPYKCTYECQCDQASLQANNKSWKTIGLGRQPSPIIRKSESLTFYLQSRRTRVVTRCYKHPSLSTLLVTWTLAKIHTSRQNAMLLSTIWFVDDKSIVTS